MVEIARRAAFLTTAIFVTTSVGAVARGESSYRLPEVRVQVPRAKPPIHTSVWSRLIDPPPVELSDSGLSLLAHGGGIVAFNSGGRMCGFAESDGTKLWCADAGSAPAYASGTVAYTIADGGVHAVDAATGARRWSHAFLIARADQRNPGLTLQMPVRESAWSTGAGFLVVRRYRADGFANFGEVDPNGRILWTSRKILASASLNPVIAPPFVLQQYIGPGATIHSMQQLLHTGPRGGFVARFGAAEVLTVQSPFAVVTSETYGDIQDQFLTFGVLTVDLRNGAVKSERHFEPDYDTNHAAGERLIPPGTVSGGRLHAEGRWLYAVIGRNIYRYNLQGPQNQRPLLVSTGDRFIGGPSLGAIYVARRDGVWALRPTDHAIQARLVAPITATVNAFSIMGRTAYLGFSNGAIRGVDADDGRTVLDTKPCVATSFDVSASRVYVVCAGLDHRIIALSRAAAQPRAHH